MSDTMDGQERLDAEAAQWISRLNALPVSRDTLEQFYSWRSSPAHRDAFMRAEAVWTRARKLGDRPAMQSLLDDTLRRTARRRRFGPAFRWPSLALAGGGLAAVIAGLFGVGVLHSGTRYATGIGEQRLIALGDGSQVRLDTDTQMDVRFTDAARHIELRRGQAFFTVAHNAARPFTVSADGTDVVATGTRFDVRRADGHTDVTLVEGSVLVGQAGRAATALSSGQQLIARPGAAPELRHADVAAATAWTSGRLVFDDAPLADAVAEINRYTRKPITLDATGVGGEHVTGAFQAGDTAAFVTALTSTFPLTSAVASDGSIHLVQTGSKDTRE